MAATVKGQQYAVQSSTLIPFPKCPVPDDPNHVVMLPHTKDCRKYYTCRNGLALEHQCPEKLYWSQVTYRCDRKEYSSCQPGEPAIPNYPFGPISAVSSVQYSAFPGDCTRFYMTSVLRCENNLQWSDQYQTCVIPQFSNCGPIAAVPPVAPLTPTLPNSPTAATPPPPYDRSIAEPSFPPLPIDPTALCANSVNNAAYIPYPRDCHKFINCGPTATVLTCPAGLFFSPVNTSCIVSNAGCQPGQ